MGDTNTNMPQGGVVFQSPGQYGSNIFDPMDGSLLEINVCDECLMTATKKHKVLLVEGETDRRRPKYTYWDGL